MAGKFPDFVIGGAPKCGITSRHFIFGQHPGIGLPDKEIAYFDVDDPITHSESSRIQQTLDMQTLMEAFILTV